jgi:hypothetical protein
VRGLGVHPDVLQYLLVLRALGDKGDQAHLSASTPRLSPETSTLAAPPSATASKKLSKRSGGAFHLGAAQR